MVTVWLTATMPDAELEGFLCLIRDWDGARDTVRVGMQVTDSAMSTTDVLAMLKRLDPPLPFLHMVPRKEGA